MAEIIELSATNKKLTLQFNNLCYKARQKGTEKYILNNVCGKFESSRLSGIIGPSGAGKTTLLNVLAGFKYKNANGQVLLNDQDRNVNDFRKISSYIAQEFALLDFLTTFETMKFTADLLLNRNMSNENKLITIKNIIKLLNLEKCSNNLVSKLSGGEKKRLSIAVELISNPPIMFFDEPTSGLDSLSSYQVMSYLHQLSKNGRMIVCVIHQPGSRLLKLIDDILVMADGQSIYNGSLDNVIPTFETVGLRCPKYYNIADFVLEVSSKEYGRDCVSTLINTNAKKYLLNEDNTDNVENNEKMSLLRHTIFFNRYKSQCGQFDAMKFFTEIKILIFRSLRCTWRDLFTTHVRIWCHIVIGFLLGAVFYDFGNDAAKVLSNSSCLFFFVLFIFFANAMPSILSCPLETLVFLREHLNGWYSITSYFTSKIIADIPLQIICPTLFVTIAYILTGQPLEIDRFSKMWVIALLTAVQGHAIGVLAGSCFKIQLALFLVPASCIPMLIFSGFFIRTYELSAAFRPLTSISYFRYSFEGLLQAVYGSNRTTLTCSEPFCFFRSPKKFLQTFEMDYDSFVTDTIVLLAWIVFLQILLYISLVIKVKRSQ